MSLPAVYLPEAEEDIASAHAWYEQQLAGLGDRFLSALLERIEQIQDNPQLYGVLRRDVRAAPVQRFPYVIYYRARAADVLVIAVQHGSRSARAWTNRA